MTEKDDKERHDIFSHNYKTKKSFFRKDNLYRFTVIAVIITVFIWGSRDYIYGYITGLEIQDIYHRPIMSPFLDKSGKSGYFVYNRAIYSIKLEITCDADNFRTSYNDTVLIPNQIIYIWFMGDVKTNTEITVKGVKIG